MAELEHSTCLGVRCDATGCGEEIRGDEMPLFEGMRYYRQLAVDHGWTFWAGRSRRCYCPDHGPSKGHKLHLVAGRPSGGDGR